MSHYRDLNKELVEQVQTMRVNMKLYCDEIINLKAELMQKHESELILRKQCYNWAVKHFLQLIQTVQPESEILPILKEYVYTHDQISSTSTSSTGSRAASGTRTSGGRSSDVLRRSSLLTMELQRSNLIINGRRSICNTSPIRSSKEASISNDDGEEEMEVQNSQSSQMDSEVEENVDDAENELPQTETPVNILLNPDIDNIIYEESLEEDDEEEDLDVELVTQSIEEVSIDVSQIRSNLKDITNNLATTIKNSTIQNSRSKLFVHKKRKHSKSRKSFSDQENATDEITTSMELEKDADVDQITKRTRYRKRLTERAVVDIEQDTLQEPRRYTNARRTLETNQSIPISHDINRSHDEVTLNSPNSVYTDMTFKNFKDVASSTPNSRQNSLLKPTSPPITNYESAPELGSTTSNISTRPSRRCKPKELTEPSLKQKLRNESGDKYIGKPKSRSRSKNEK